MTARTAARLAWSLCTGCVVGGGGVVVLQLLNGTSELGWAPLAALLAFAVVGGLVAARQPRNSVGWLLLAVAVCMTVRLVGESYAIYALITAPGSLPGGLYGAWVQWSWFGVVAILAIFLPLYFPTGRLLSPRWRPVLWLGIVYLSAVVSNALQPGPTEWLATPRPATRWCTCPRPSRCWM
jgi:two-component system NarL family sensor kinase